VTRAEQSLPSAGLDIKLSSSIRQRADKVIE